MIVFLENDWILNDNFFKKYNLYFFNFTTMYNNYFYIDKYLPPHFTFSLKTFIFLLIVFGIRGIIPRYRYDQVSRLNWKQLLLICTTSFLIIANLLIIIW